MSPDELRALADRLRDPASPDADDIDRAADYLRACADAQPVGWMHPDGRVVPTATMDQAYRDGGAMQSSLRDYTIPLYAAPVPPQEDRNVWQQIIPEDAPQAEPVAIVRVHRTGGNAGIAWSAVPTGAQMMRDGDLLYAAPQPAPDKKLIAQAQPVAWIDEFGNAFPLDAWKPAKRTGYLDYHKKAWKPLFTHPAPQPQPEQHCAHERFGVAGNVFDSRGVARPYGTDTMSEMGIVPMCDEPERQPVSEMDAETLVKPMSLTVALDFADNPRPYHTLQAPADTNGELYRALRVLAAAYRAALAAKQEK